MDAGVSLTIDATDFNDALARLGPLLSIDGTVLMDVIGAAGESQTRRRISDEKSAPDGTPWKENAAKTPTLVQTGSNLLGSIAYTSAEDEAVWGASWEYAHIHQEGAVILPQTAKALRFQGPNGTVFAQKVTIPARPFVGLSDDNREEITGIVTDFLSGLAAEARR